MSNKTDEGQRGSKNMNIVVTGGEGFIGSEVCDRLSQKGYDVISIDRRTRDNITNGNSNYSKYKIDICDYQKVKETLSNADGIIHLAAVSRVVWGEFFPQECFDINIKGTLNVIEAAKKSKKEPWIIFGSSREVYGETNGIAVTEDYPLNPINTYGISKMAAEQQVKCYSLHNNAKAIILRFSNVYGTLGDILDRVTPKFIMNALLEKPITIHGGDQIMDFTYIEDTVNGILATVDHLNSTNEKQYFNYFHLLPGEPHSLYDLLDYIKLYIPTRLQIEHTKKREYDVEKFVGNPEKAKKVLGFVCKNTLKEGIRKTIKVFQKGLREERDKVLQKFKEDQKCELL